MNDLVSVREILDKQFTQPEAELLKGLLRADASVELVIPQDIDPSKLWNSMEACGKLTEVIWRARETLKPIVGRLLGVLEEYPDLYRSKGYKNWDDFMSRGMEKMFGISRSEAYALYRVMRVFPELTIEEYFQAGIANLQTASRAVGENPKCRDKVLAAAKEMEVKPFKEYIGRLTNTDPDDYDYGLIMEHVSKSVKVRWDEFMKRAEKIHGTTSRAEIIDYMIAECLSSWEPQAAASA
jgi:hypothetical protein